MSSIFWKWDFTPDRKLTFVPVLESGILLVSALALAQNRRVGPKNILVEG